MALNKKDLEKLSPQERLKKLKELEKEIKSEVDEISTLIRKSEQEVKTEKIAEQITPEHKPVDIDSLFEAEQPRNLESSVRVEDANLAVDYNAKVQLYEAYSQLKELYSAVTAGGSLTEDQRIQVGLIGERLNAAEKYKTDGEKVSEVLDTGFSILYKLISDTGLDTSTRK